VTGSTSSNYGTINISGSSTLIFRVLPSGCPLGRQHAQAATDSLGGGSSQVTINVAIYTPTQTVSCSGAADASGRNLTIDGGAVKGTACPCQVKRGPAAGAPHPRARVAAIVSRNYGKHALVDNGTA
jgi:hypothetical protein